MNKLLEKLDTLLKDARIKFFIIGVFFLFFCGRITYQQVFSHEAVRLEELKKSCDKKDGVLISNSLSNNKIFPVCISKNLTL